MKAAVEILAWLSIALIVVSSFARLRDSLVDTGWISTHTRLARGAVRAKAAQSQYVLRELGYDLERRNSVRVSVLSGRLRHGADDVRGRRPDRAFLRLAPEWIVKLEPEYEAEYTGYYLDVMGAMSDYEHGESIPQILCHWLALLVESRMIKPFDFLVVPKDGNVLLGQAAANLSGTNLVICKGIDDQSRVRRPNAAPHVTDFEGLRTVIKKSRDSGNRVGRQWRGILVDDSCTGGSQLVSAFERFNNFVSDDADGVDIAPLEDAVVLFRRFGNPRATGAIDSSVLKLHALISVGPKELSRLAGWRSRFGHGDPLSFKSGAECAASKSLA